MNRNTRLIGIGLLIATCATALAVQDAITLKFAPAEGAVYKYKISGSFQFSGADATLSGNVQDKVTKVDKDGNYTVEASQSGMAIEFNGQTMSPPDTKDTTTFKPNGDVVDYQSDTPSPDARRMADLNTFVYPDKPVKVGDEWTSSLAEDSKNGVVPATVKYKFDSLEKIGSHDTAKIKVTYKETSGSDPAGSDGFVWIDTKDGSMVKGQAAWTNVPTPGGLATASVTMERVD